MPHKNSAIIVGFTLTMVNDFHRFLSQFLTNCHGTGTLFYSGSDYPANDIFYNVACNYLHILCTISTPTINITV